MEKEELLAFIKEMIEVLESSTATEITVEEDDVRLVLRKKEGAFEEARPTTVVKTTMKAEEIARPIEGAKEKEGEENVYILRSPMRGIFYHAPAPDAPPFVEKGDMVDKGQRVGLIEAMKVFNDVQSEVRGKVRAILAENGALVEEGDPLLEIEIQEDEG